MSAEAQNKELCIADSDRPMSRGDILGFLYQMSFSQGFYGRVLRDIGEDEDGEILETLVKQNFKDPLDLVKFLEG
ncbi:MAG: hypothetical protein LBK29_04740 [Oscillospiraceae bacterium]|jgi:hypothetical protein|nr:hypothetical protein [Oscillospiraceae bacterium]